MTRHAASLAAALIASVFLSSCESVPFIPQTGTGSLRDFIHTATGALDEAGKQATAAIELGKMGVDKAKQTYDSTMSRGALFQEGVKEIQSGKEKVQEAIER